MLVDGLFAVYQAEGSARSMPLGTFLAVLAESSAIAGRL